MRGLVATVTSCVGGKLDDTFAIQVAPCNQEKYFVYKSLTDFQLLWDGLASLAHEVKSAQAHLPEAKTSVAAKWLASFIDHYAFRDVVTMRRSQEKETISTLNMLLELVVRRATACYVDSSIFRSGVGSIERRLALLVRDFLEFAQHDAHRRGSCKGRKRQLSSHGDIDMEAKARTLSPTAPLFPTHSVGSFHSSMSDDGTDVSSCGGSLGSYDELLNKSPKARKVEDKATTPMFPIRKVGLSAPSGLSKASIPPRRRVFAEVDFA